MTDPQSLAAGIEGLFGQFDAAQQRHPIIRRGEREPIPPHVRSAVKRRDRYACVWCMSTRNLELDHIVPWSAGGSDKPENLRTLCAVCNQDRSNRRYAGDTGPRLPIANECTRCNRPDEPEWERQVRAYCLTCELPGSAFKADLW